MALPLVLGALRVRPVAAELVLDEFDYGGGPKSLCYLGDASQGWAGSWLGYCNAVAYDPMAAIYWNQAGYQYPANVTGGIVFGSYLDMQRSFAHSLHGRFWVSFLIDASAYSGARDVNFTADDVIYFGVDGANSDLTPFIDTTVGNSPLFTGATVTRDDSHLVVMKWELASGAGASRISMWIDPPSLTTGEVGLGAPRVFADGLTIDHWSTWHVAFANGSLADAFRVSFPGSTPASLEEVLLGVPVALLNSPEAQRCQTHLAAASGTYVKQVFGANRKCLDNVTLARLLILPSACATQPSVVAELSRRGLALRATAERYCAGPILGQTHACAATVDDLVSSDGRSGCLIDSLGQAVSNMVAGVYGGLF